MTDETAARNKAIVRQFYKDVYVDWNMGVADTLISPRSDPTIGRRMVPPDRKRSGTTTPPYALRSRTRDTKSTI